MAIYIKYSSCVLGLYVQLRFKFHQCKAETPTVITYVKYHLVGTPFKNIYIYTFLIFILQRIGEGEVEKH